MHLAENFSRRTAASSDQRGRNEIVFFFLTSVLINY